MKDNILSILGVLEGFKTAIQNTHWAAANHSQHKQCDELSELVSSKEDEIAEIAQGLYGQLDNNSVKPTAYSVSTAKQMVEDLTKKVEEFYSTLTDEEIGLKSCVEDFIGQLNQQNYLFDLVVSENYMRDILRTL